MNASTTELRRELVICTDPDLVIPRMDYRLIIENLKGKTGIDYARGLGRKLMIYFYGTKDGSFWIACKENPSVRAAMAKARRAISGHVQELTGTSILRELEAFGNEKRRCIKNIKGRGKLQHVCKLCEKRCKDSAHKRRHETNCRNAAPPLTTQSRSAPKRPKRQNQSAADTRLVCKARDGYQIGLQVQIVKDKSRGIFARRIFRNRDFVCVYGGELIGVDEARERERHYESIGEGCYMYYFRHDGRDLCFDATEECDKFGRLINHSRKHPNVKPHVLVIDGLPCIVFRALREIRIGEEILYDYGDRDKEAAKKFTWLKA